MSAPDEASDAQLSARIEAALAGHASTLDGAVWRVCCEQWGVWSGPAVGELLRLAHKIAGHTIELIIGPNGACDLIVSDPHGDETGEFNAGSIVEALTRVLEYPL